jgi:hypothetical protein
MISKKERQIMEKYINPIEEKGFIPKKSAVGKSPKQKKQLFKTIKRK